MNNLSSENLKAIYTNIVKVLKLWKVIWKNRVEIWRGIKKSL